MGIPVPRDQIIPASTTALLHFIHALLQRRNAVSPVPSHFHIGPFAHSPSVLKTFDRYIIKKFLGTFLLILVLIMAIAVVFDVSEKTEDFAGVGKEPDGNRWNDCHYSNALKRSKRAG